jgi:hypothetical protein
MNWKKTKIKGNETNVDCWISKCKTYMILQNINDGRNWIFEIVKVNNKGEEAALGIVKTLKDAKLIAEDDNGY